MVCVRVRMGVGVCLLASVCLCVRVCVRACVYVLSRHYVFGEESCSFFKPLLLLEFY